MHAGIRPQGRSCSHLIQMNQEGDVVAHVGGKFAVFGCQQKSFGRSVGALLLPSCVDLLHSFGAVIQHHFTVA